MPLILNDTRETGIIANDLQAGYVRWLCIPLLPLLAFFLWLYALPSVTVNYSKEGKEEFSYVWNVQRRIYRGRMLSGGGAYESGYTFPDDDFFMEFDWWDKSGRSRCISIIPKWPSTTIYLDADGNIDWRKESGTDVDRLKSALDASHSCGKTDARTSAMPQHSYRLSALHMPCLGNLFQSFINDTFGRIPQMMRHPDTVRAAMVLAMASVRDLIPRQQADSHEISWGNWTISCRIEGKPLRRGLFRRQN